MERRAEARPAAEIALIRDFVNGKTFYRVEAGADRACILDARGELPRSDNLIADVFVGFTALCRDGGPDVTDETGEKR
jgi:hypothetical protein